MADIVTVHDLLRINLGRHPEKTALVLGEETLSYRDLGERVARLSGRLRASGVGCGDRVGIHLPKGFEEVVATLAIARLGGVFVNINHQWSVHQVRHVCRDCQVKVLVTGDRRARVLGDSITLDEVPVTMVLGIGIGHPGTISRDDDLIEDLARVVSPKGDDLAALLYTSGSTGQPKGVMVSHANIVEGARKVSSYLENVPGDRLLSVPPLSFDYGLNQLTTSLLVGATLVLQPLAMASEIVRTLSREKITGLALVPASWIPLVRFLKESRTTLPHLRYATNTGGAIPAAVLRDLRLVLPGTKIFLMYGLTEAFRSTYLPPELFEKKMGAIGKAIPGEEVYVVHPEGRLCGPDEEGELVHRGSLVSLGYWGCPDLTQRIIRTCEYIPDLGPEERVVYSGDVVRRDRDGILWFVGRTDAMIKCSGHRLSPTEVEDLIHESGMARDVVAFGVANEDLGQVVHVAVVPVDPSHFRPEELTAYCRTHMPAYMVPRRIHVWETVLPLTGSGKIDRRGVAESCLAGNQNRGK